MQVVPIQALPNQTFQAQLGGQSCQLSIYQTPFSLFMDVVAGGTTIITSVRCAWGTLIVRDVYLGFIGDFCFLDLQGTSDPVYTGLGSRYILLYLAPSDLPSDIV